MSFNSKSLFILIPFFFVLFSFPKLSFAQTPVTPTCNCFFEGSFSGTSDCQPVPLPAGATQEQCKLTCENKFEKSLKQVSFSNNPEEKAGYAAACTKTHTENGAAADASAAIPKLEVPIPGVTFTAPLKSAKLLSVSFLSQYISGLYKYLLSIAGVIAIVMVMIGGFQYVLGAGAKGQGEKGKERIKNGVIGLILLLSVYLILYTVNPQLTVFKPLTLEVIKEKDLDTGDSSEFGKKLLKDFPDAPPKYTEPAVPSAATCARQSKLTTQADRDAAFAIQQQTGFPAAVLLAQRILEGPTFGIKCGPFMTSKKGDANVLAQLDCQGKGTLCTSGFTWECTKNPKYLPPASPGSGSPADGSDCGKGEKAGKGYVAVHGYACFQKSDPNNPFGPLLNFYNKHSCYGAAKAKYGGNPEAFAYAVQACGYATGQGYAGALVARMKQYCLYAGEVKKPPTDETSDPSDDSEKEE
ncbi:MAG: hypothetical protein AAB431_01915 [Patescibacteria group bacterium]